MKTWYRIKRKLSPSRINRSLHRWYISHSKNPRPDSSPYISGDTFRALAKHIYDETDTFDPEKVAAGDIVFVKSDRLEVFFDNIHPQIHQKYILISHNGDDAVNDSLAKRIDDKIIMWYAQNICVKHPKLTPIPIGLENMSFYTNGIVNYFDRIRKLAISKKSRILVGFSVHTNPKNRQPAYDTLKTFSTTDFLQSWPNPKKYLDILSKYKFIASPEGNGIDCIRTWEALYLGVVPIVQRSILTEHFLELRLPLWIIDDWNELSRYSESDLEKKYSELIKKTGKRALEFNYWINKIKKS